MRHRFVDFVLMWGYRCHILPGCDCGAITFIVENNCTATFLRKQQKKNFLIISLKFPAHFLYHAEGGSSCDFLIGKVRSKSDKKIPTKDFIVLLEIHNHLCFSCRCHSHLSVCDWNYPILNQKTENCLSCGIKI